MIASPSAVSPASSKPATSDLFDQSALSTLAQRLVEAAKSAGADAADAVAVRGVSQGVEVRDGRVEESERSEADDVGLRIALVPLVIVVMNVFYALSSYPAACSRTGRTDARSWPAASSS